MFYKVLWGSAEIRILSFFQTTFNESLYIRNCGTEKLDSLKIVLFKVEWFLRLLSLSWEVWASSASVGSRRWTQQLCMTHKWHFYKEETKKAWLLYVSGFWAVSMEGKCLTVSDFRGRGDYWNMRKTFLSFWLHLQNLTGWISNF